MYLKPCSALVIAVLLALPAMQVQAARVVVDGTVVDASGQPRSDAAVSTLWTWNEGRPVKTGSIRMSESGAFRGSVVFKGKSTTLLAYAEDGGLAGMATVFADHPNNITITLEPSVHVKGQFICSQLGGDAGELSGSWTHKRSTLARVRRDDGVIDIRLPAGAWSYSFYGSDVKSRRGKIDLMPGTSEHAMGRQDLPATFISLNRGRTVDDWNVTDARGVEIDKAQIKHYQGKWLLVEFWAYW